VCAHTTGRHLKYGDFPLVRTQTGGQDTESDKDTYMCLMSNEEEDTYMCLVLHRATKIQGSDTRYTERHRETPIQGVDTEGHR
jgi:hypothetical protein